MFRPSRASDILIFMPPIYNLQLSNCNCFDFNIVSDLIKCFTLFIYFDDFLTISMNVFDDLMLYLSDSYDRKSLCVTLFLVCGSLWKYFFLFGYLATLSMLPDMLLLFLLLQFIVCGITPSQATMKYLTRIFWANNSNQFMYDATTTNSMLMFVSCKPISTYTLERHMYPHR